jgi:hypothetical protein
MNKDYKYQNANSSKSIKQAHIKSREKMIKMVTIVPKGAKLQLFRTGFGYSREQRITRGNRLTTVLDALRVEVWHRIIPLSHSHTIDCTRFS